VELYEAMRHTPSCRYFTDDDVPDEVLWRVLDNARFASSGGNRQGWRTVVVKDPDLRRAIAELHARQWDEYIQHAQHGVVGYQGDGSGAKMEHGTTSSTRRLGRTDDFTANLAAVPVHLVCYVELAALAVTDKNLPRQSIVGGGSLYTMVHNMLLACTNEGLGSALTTLLAAEQPHVDALLGVPEGFALGALVAVGWPVRDKQIRKLRRKPVEEIAFRDRWGAAFDA